MFGKYLERVKQKRPLIHCITNYVTVNDVANVVLAIGASPIMADEPMEVEAITERCDALVINIGTLNQRTVESMILAGVKANELGHPVVLDPVGAGASSLRTGTALRILSEVKVAVIRANGSEIRALAQGSTTTQGVDVATQDQIEEGELETGINTIQSFARFSQCIILMTGAVDLACDGKSCFILRNGHPMMSQITGAGCQLSSLVAVYLAANPGEPLAATAAAAANFGLAGQLAFSRLLAMEGTSTYRNRLIDAVSLLTPVELEGEALYEIYSK